MEETFLYKTIFDKKDFTLHALAKGEYESCTFNNCNFADSDLSGFKFINCLFIACNLSLTKLTKTALQDVKFKDCKMIGLRFDACNEFLLSFSFDDCQLSCSSFYKTRIKKTVFKNCQLQEVDFEETDLTSAVFDNCILTQTLFNQTNLEKADFRTSCNYSIDPELNRIKKARFSISDIKGLLDKYDIEIEQLPSGP